MTYVRGGSVGSPEQKLKIPGSSRTVEFSPLFSPAEIWRPNFTDFQKLDSPVDPYQLFSKIRKFVGARPFDPGSSKKSGSYILTRCIKLPNLVALGLPVRPEKNPKIKHSAPPSGELPNLIFVKIGRRDQAVGV
jgi:hypothetical protein